MFDSIDPSAQSETSMKLVKHFCQDFSALWYEVDTRVGEKNQSRADETLWMMLSSAKEVQEHAPVRT